MRFFGFLKLDNILFPFKPRPLLMLTTKLKYRKTVITGYIGTYQRYRSRNKDSNDHSMHHPCNHTDYI